MRIDITNIGENAQFSLADESILFANHAPEIDNSTATPTGALTTRSTTFQINLSDTEFGTAQGEELIATLYVDGTAVGTDTLTSSGTASVDYDATSGGSLTYYWVVEDSYGAETASQTFTLQTPSTLYIRQEETPNELVSEATVQVTAYYGDEVLRRNVTDGTMNLTGFPTDQPIIVRTNATDYYTRTAVIETIYDQNSVYLLNSSKEAYLVRFGLQDSGGLYPDSETVLFVERDILLNGSVEWRTIAGDNFGVQGVPTMLRADERYRLRIKNLDTGVTATIGAYTAIQDETVTLSPASATIEITDSEKAYGWEVTKNTDSNYILFEYLDEESGTESLTLAIHERYNDSNVLVDNVTFDGSNSIVYQHPLSATEANTTWMAEIYLDRNGTVEHFREPITGPRADIIPDELDGVWRAGIGVFILIVVGMAFSGLDQRVAPVATALVGGVLWQVGLLSTVTTGPAVVLSIAVSVLYHYGGKN